ncbi:hypothetical protein AB0G32_02285 [Streptomyces sp. NPDC023723]|uniref:hypothetical protein n=1 Tax=Streptomyces sp. NPDC023723 TaxID=3154323 RepID=UPI0033E44E8A
MNAELPRINRVGFAEYDDRAGIFRETDLPALAQTPRRILDLVLPNDSGSVETMLTEAQADFVVPLGMAAAMLDGGGYADVELVSAACAVRSSAERYTHECPKSRLPFCCDSRADLT